MTNQLVQIKLLSLFLRFSYFFKNIAFKLFLLLIIPLIDLLTSHFDSIL